MLQSRIPSYNSQVNSVSKHFLLPLSVTSFGLVVFFAKVVGTARVRDIDDNVITNALGDY